MIVVVAIVVAMLSAMRGRYMNNQVSRSTRTWKTVLTAIACFLKTTSMYHVYFTIIRYSERGAIFIGGEYCMCGNNEISAVRLLLDMSAF